MTRLTFSGLVIVLVSVAIIVGLMPSAGAAFAPFTNQDKCCDPATELPPAASCHQPCSLNLKCGGGGNGQLHAGNCRHPKIGANCRMSGQSWILQHHWSCEEVQDCFNPEESKCDYIQDYIIGFVSVDDCNGTDCD